MTALPYLSHVHIGRVSTADADTFFSLIDALADYEKLPRPDAAARQRLLSDGFGPSPRFEAFLARVGGVAAGYAITFQTYSSFLAKPTQYLEDIFVLPQFRKQKVGLALFLSIASLARERGCGRMEWTVLDWNEPAHEFYRSLDALHMHEWSLYRLDSKRLQSLPDYPPTSTFSEIQ
jgi:GNAT superfamily N-acetyltransferase